MERLTRILELARQGDGDASRRLAAVLYEDLRSIARREMGAERPDHTLQPTALVHEAWVRLFDGDDARFENRAHFFGAAAQALRRVLVEHARARRRDKRGGGRERVDLEAHEPSAPVSDDELLALDEALVKLAEFAPRQARIVELRFFAGMTIPEAAELLGVSHATVERGWRSARAWLQAELGEGDGR